jgi:tRNA-specific 2-thiouridylase
MTPDCPVSKRVAVAMSGGLDSTVAAALLQEQGVEVVGLTLLLLDESPRCVAEADTQRARQAAEALGIAHYVIDARDAFKERIMDPFVQTYTEGRTPSPCVCCNPAIKFGLLLAEADRHNCSHLATGHYARLEQRPDGPHLLRPADPDKDQTYFLQRLTPEILRRVRFPLSHLTKDEARAFARRHHLKAQEHAESQDLCFVDGQDYAGLVETRYPALKQPGDIINLDGQTVGQHEGFYRYTIGQRKGIGVAGPEPYYVCALDAAHNRISIAPRDKLYRDDCRIRDLNWIAGHPPPANTPLQVFIRYRHNGVAATLEPQADGSNICRFASPQFAVTPGQAAAFYHDNELLGGGWITG